MIDHSVLAPKKSSKMAPRGILDEVGSLWEGFGTVLGGFGKQIGRVCSWFLLAVAGFLLALACFLLFALASCYSAGVQVQKQFHT